MDFYFHLFTYCIIHNKQIVPDIKTPENMIARTIDFIYSFIFITESVIPKAQIKYKHRQYFFSIIACNAITA